MKIIPPELIYSIATRMLDTGAVSYEEIVDRDPILEKNITMWISKMVEYDIMASAETLLQSKKALYQTLCAEIYDSLQSDEKYPFERLRYPK